MRKKMSEIVAEIAAEYEVSADDMRSPKRHKHLAEARWSAFYMAFQCGHTYAAIAAFFDRHVDTVYHGIRKMRAQGVAI